MSVLLKGIDCVIFDFGEVIIELDYPKVIEGFSKVARKNEEEIHEMVVTAPILQDFEVSKISPPEFRRQINELLGTSLVDTEFDQIWNSMLKHLPKERMDLLLEVGKRFDTYVLSNSNVIHEEAFNHMIKEKTGKQSLHDFVKKCYFSQDIRLRKPYRECYEYVIEDIGINPHKILFLDDRLDNIEGARSVGMKGFQVTNASKQLNEIFAK